MALNPPNANPAAQLIAQLRDAKTPLARARVVVSAWRTVRGLSPRDRSNLITQLGLEGADDLVEAIAAHEGTKPPAELMQAVNQMQKLEPDQLRSVAARMRDPRQRGAVVKEGLKTLETKLAGPPPLPPPGPPAGFSAAKTARPPASPPPPPPAPPAPAPVTVMPAVSWPLREAATPSPQPAQPAQPASQAAPAPVPAPVEAKPAAPPVAVAPVAPAVPAAFVPQTPKPVVFSQPAPAPEPAAAVRGSLAEELAAVPVLTSRFRLLRRRLAAVRQLSPGELRGVVEVFADGWARRRALMELLEAGIPARTADALALVDTLQSPGDRSWCLSALADSRALSPEDRATLLRAAPSPAGRRRLELRLGEA